MMTESILEDTTEQSSLRYVTDIDLSIRRRKHGKGFRYFDGGNRPIGDMVILQRIKLLGIPPAWRSVWICKFTNGHIQAVGRDGKGRKQYVYHAEWKKVQQQNKFNKMILFGEMLPKIRKRVAEDMDRKELSRKRVIATVIWLLGRTFIRIGNSEYARNNKSYGLTTFEQKHVEVDGNRILFEFQGKGGAHQSVEVQHARVAKTIRKCIELPGYELFQYLDQEGGRHAIDSSDVNDYLKTISGEEFTAKDFRTWGGTVLAAWNLYEIGSFATQSAAKKNIKLAVKEVAAHLRNTATVCRSYYIHPAIISSYLDQSLIPHFDKVLQGVSGKPTEMGTQEYATWTLLRLKAEEELLHEF